MRETPAWLEEREIHLSNGDHALWSYDREGDILEISFQDKPAMFTVELTEGIYLRLDQQREPLSLGFVSASLVMQEKEFGLPLIILDGLEGLPQPDQNLALSALRKPPVDLFLKIYTFQSDEPPQHVMPVALFEYPKPQSIELAA